jgi:outer membrane murein-binding lipoprotein Lpp
VSEERFLAESAADIFTEAIRHLYDAFEEPDILRRRRLMTDAVLAALAHGDVRARRHIESLETRAATLQSKVAVLEAEVRELRDQNRALRGGR